MRILDGIPVRTSFSRVVVPPISSASSATPFGPILFAADKKTNGVQVIIFWFLAMDCVQLTSILSTVVLDLRTLKMEFAPDEPILLPKVVQMT